MGRIAQWLFFDPAAPFDRFVEQLREALDTDLDYGKTHTRIYVRAREWESTGDESLLLRGSDLRAAEAWLRSAAGMQPPPTPLHERYLRDSRKEANRRLSAQLVADAELAANDRDLTLSVVLAVEAYRLTPSVSLERLLRRGLRLPRLVFSVPPCEAGRPAFAEAAEDGRSVAVARGMTVEILEIPSGRRLCTLEHRANVRAMRFSPKGRYFITWESMSTDVSMIRVWEIPDGCLVAQETIGRWVFALEFDPSEHYAAAGSETAVVFDLARRASVRLKHRDVLVSSLAFQHDGRGLAAGQSGSTRTRKGWRDPIANDVWIWSVPKWRRIARIPKTGEVDGLAFSGEDKYLVGVCSRGASHAVCVWKASRPFGWNRFKEAGRIEHGNKVNQLVFDIHWWEFATACDDGVVRIIAVTESEGQSHVGERYHLTLDGPATSVASSSARGRRHRIGPGGVGQPPNQKPDFGRVAARLRRRPTSPDI